MSVRVRPLEPGVNMRQKTQVTGWRGRGAGTWEGVGVGGMELAAAT